MGLFFRYLLDCNPNLGLLFPFSYARMQVYPLVVIQISFLIQGAPVKVRRPIDYNPSLAATLGPRQPNPNLNQGVVSLTPGLATGLQ